MSLSHGNNSIPLGKLLMGFDASNTKAYPGTGNIIYDMKNANNAATVNMGTDIEFATDEGGAFNMIAGNSYINFTGVAANIASILNLSNFAIETLVQSTDVTYPHSYHPLFVGSTARDLNDNGWSIGNSWDGTDTSVSIRAADGTNFGTVNMALAVQHRPVINKIYHRVCNIDRSSGVTTTLYQNGELVGQENISNVTGGIYDESNTDFQGGTLFGYVFGWRFQGKVYSVKIYDGTLSIDEIGALFNNIDKRYTI